jgi:hypothetical protein
MVGASPTTKEPPASTRAAMAAAESADAMAVRAASICAVIEGTQGLNCSLRVLRVQALVRSSSA